MKVLVVDDDPDQLALRCMLLTHNGFEVIESSDAASAIRLAQAQKPTCGIIDLRIPTEQAGWELIRKLKQIDESVHIFVVTGLDPARLSPVPERDLVDEILSKGSSSAHLMRRMKELSG